MMTAKATLHVPHPIPASTESMISLENYTRCPDCGQYTCVCPDDEPDDDSCHCEHPDCGAC